MKYSDMMVVRDNEIKSDNWIRDSSTWCCSSSGKRYYCNSSSSMDMLTLKIMWILIVCNPTVILHCWSRLMLSYAVSFFFLFFNPIFLLLSRIQLSELFHYLVLPSYRCISSCLVLSVMSSSSFNFISSCHLISIFRAGWSVQDHR